MRSHKYDSLWKRAHSVSIQMSILQKMKFSPSELYKLGKAEKSYCWWILLLLLNFTVIFTVRFNFLSISGLAPQGLDCPGPFDSVWSGVVELSVRPPWWRFSETVCQKCKSISHIWMLELGLDPPDVTVPLQMSPLLHLPLLSKRLTVPFVENPNPPPKFCSTFMYPRPNTHTHTPTALHVSGSRAGRRHIREWGASELEQKKHHWTPDPNQLLPTSPHLLHRSAPDQTKLLTLSPSHTHTDTHTDTHTGTHTHLVSLLWV